MVYEYEVEGIETNSQRFPDDMLRYDQAEIVGEQKRTPVGTKLGYQKCRYKIRGKVRPTVMRWNSFGWRVTNVKLIEKKEEEG